MTQNPSPARLAALTRLYTAIANEVDGGETIPCLGPRRDRWTSDDWETRQAAALECGTCRCLQACEAYVSDFPESAGVWAGRIFGRSAA